MIFNYLKRRIRERKEQRLRLRLVNTFGCCIPQESLKELDCLYRWIVSQPRKDWGMLAKAARAFGPLTPYPYPYPEKNISTLDWLRTGTRPADASLPRKEHRNAGNGNSGGDYRNTAGQSCTRH